MRALGWSLRSSCQRRAPPLDLSPFRIAGIMPFTSRLWQFPKGTQVPSLKWILFDEMVPPLFLFVELATWFFGNLEEISNRKTPTKECICQRHQTLVAHWYGRSTSLRLIGDLWTQQHTICKRHRAPQSGLQIFRPGHWQRHGSCLCDQGCFGARDRLSWHVLQDQRRRLLVQRWDISGGSGWGMPQVGKNLGVLLITYFLCMVLALQSTCWAYLPSHSYCRALLCRRFQCDPHGEPGGPHERWSTSHHGALSCRWRRRFWFQHRMYMLDI